MIYAYIDAATKGNPGPSGAGILWIDNGEQTQMSFPLPVLSNHQAEFESLILLLEALIAKNRQSETIFVFSDSKLVVATLEKNEVKNAHFQEYLTRINALLEEFPLFIIQWIDRKRNKGADNLARQGLQKALTKK